MNEEVSLRRHWIRENTLASYSAIRWSFLRKGFTHLSHFHVKPLSRLKSYHYLKMPPLNPSDLPDQLTHNTIASRTAVPHPPPTRPPILPQRPLQEDVRKRACGRSLRALLRPSLRRPHSQLRRLSNGRTKRHPARCLHPHLHACLACLGRREGECQQLLQ